MSATLQDWATTKSVAEGSQLMGSAFGIDENLFCLESPYFIEF